MQEAVDLNKRKIAFKLFHLCEPHAGGGAGPPRVCVDQHEPHVGCSCGDGIPLNGCDLLLSILVKLGGEGPDEHLGFYSCWARVGGE